MDILIGLIVLSALVFAAAAIGAKRHKDGEEYNRYLSREYGMNMEAPNPTYSYLINR